VAHNDAASGEFLVGVLSPDIFLKSRRTRAAMLRVLFENLETALGPGATVERWPGHRLRFTGPAPDPVTAASRVFGIAAVQRMAPVPFGSVDELAERVAEMSASRVAGKTFAVRPKRTGVHEWRSRDLAVRLGDLLRAEGGTVDLGAPEVTVEIRINGDEAAYVADTVPGPGGLPLGSQDGALVLLSGGIDSPVAAWMMMSRGCPIDVVHFVLDCAQGDHALAVAYRLWRQWGAGSMPAAHVVDLRPAVDVLVAGVGPKLRQVALKVLMVRAASAIAAEERLAALVAGESLGQVSSQTLTHLAAVSLASPTPILRPLVGLPKSEIVHRAVEIGTFELSSRAREVCDLSGGGPVEVAASATRVLASAEQVPEELWSEAVLKRQRFLLADWMPGMTTGP
jgi:thiamine biosynthesis protein ThiI